MASHSKWFMGAFPSDLPLALGEVQGSQCCSLPKVMVGVSPVQVLAARVLLLKSQRDVISVSVSLTVQNGNDIFVQFLL